MIPKGHSICPNHGVVDRAVQQEWGQRFGRYTNLGEHTSGSGRQNRPGASNRTTCGPAVNDPRSLSFNGRLEGKEIDWRTSEKYFYNP